MKLMFLAAVARRRKLSNGVWFDGKIEIWPIVDVKVVQHSGKHHHKGTKELVPMAVERETYKKPMIKGVIPAIKFYRPRLEGQTIFVQEDRAKLHTNRGIMEVIEEATGEDIVIETQPANSPDLNIIDLGFFHSIQQLKEDVLQANKIAGVFLPMF
ncbi:unnamed protein product [Choristocarpus tenellus]